MMTDSKDALARREARLAALRERRESRPDFGAETTVAAKDVESGDFVVRTARVDWSGPRGRRYYQPAYSVDRLVETKPSTIFYAGIREVRFETASGATVSVPADSQVVVRRRPR